MIETTELRVALTVDDFDAAVEFYRRVLGQELSARWTEPAGNVGLFRLPRATLELLDAEAAAGVDAAEVGRRVSGPVRLALGVVDAEAACAVAIEVGGRLMGQVRPAPWGDRVGRVETPEGLQLTLFTEA
jgi:catechol 2,3-dioxygenase-like lactoylglutathione lyase family enzyme